MEPTKWYLSKRFYVNVLFALACIMPQTQDFVKQNLSETGTLWGVLNIVLAAISKGKLQIL